MNKFYLAPIVALMIGCGLTEEQYSEDYVTKYCDEWTACEAEGDCPISDTSDDDVEGESTCEFDASAARDCLDGDWTCDADTNLPVGPTACENVCGDAAGEEEEEEEEEAAE